MLVEQAEAKVPLRGILCFACSGDKTGSERWIGYAADVGIITSLLDYEIIVNRITAGIPVSSPACIPIDAEVEVVLACDVVDSHFDQYLRCYAVDCGEQVPNVPDFALYISNNDMTGALDRGNRTLCRLEFVQSIHDLFDICVNNFKSFSDKSLGYLGHFFAR